MKCPHCKKEFKDPARVEGGRKSKRVITAEQQAVMQKCKADKKRRGHGHK